MLSKDYISQHYYWYRYDIDTDIDKDIDTDFVAGNKEWENICYVNNRHK